ncbi:MAG: hypothetical protein ACTSQE_08380 [Candidatus Heimdallarchaeaceae archaeon]
MKKDNDIGRILSLTGGENILRRYFVMNGFDGALTALGIIIGSLIAHGFKHVSWEDDLVAAETLIIMGVGASIAMGVSGFWIAYLTERAERTKEIKDLEADMITDLNNTRIAKANKKVSWIISAVDGLSPFIFATVSLSPFLFVMARIFTMQVGYFISVTLIFVEVVVLGMLLGAISKENKILYALKIIPAIIVVAALTFLLEFVSTT